MLQTLKVPDSFVPHALNIIVMTGWLVAYINLYTGWGVLLSPQLYGGGGGCYFHQNRTWMCLPDLENMTFSIPIFYPISHPSVYHFWKKSTQFWPYWVLFTILSPKILPIYVIWASSSLTKTPGRYTKFREKAPQKAGTYMYIMSMWDNLNKLLRCLNKVWTW